MPTPKKKSDSNAAATGSLDAYRKKRSAAKTPEPIGIEPARQAKPGVGEVGLFVVQKHGARRVHYDLRLELGGVLKSWAVPRGPSLDPKEKRLAVQTEDHPLEYNDFEGIIPEGNYGAGAMIVWDRGTWQPLEDPVLGFEKGKLLFELNGYKLHGAWTVFRTKPSAIHRGKTKDEDKQWLLVKKPDQAGRSNTEDGPPETSILSGLTVEELRDGARKIDSIRTAIESLGAKKGPIDPTTHKLMLAQAKKRPFSRKGWIYELKYDGYRLLASKVSGTVFLRYRNGHDATDLYPEIVRAVQALPVDDLLLDGEVVVLNGEGRPSFGLLQKRALLSRPLDIQRSSLLTPASLFCFDLVGFDGYDLRSLKLLERKEQLETLVPLVGPLRYLDHIEERGEAVFDQIQRLGLEGMVAKKADSAYLGRRSAHWLKYRVEHTDDFVIVGFSRPKGSRKGFGSLHLAAWDEAAEPGEELVYAGGVGTGFDQQQLDDIAALLEPLVRKTPSCRLETKPLNRPVWVEPELACEVRYKELTSQGQLRHAVFLRLRPDKPLHDCLLPRPREPDEQVPPVAVGNDDGKEPKPRAAAGLKFTNLDKVFWPEEKYTKGDLIEYYRKVAPWMLRYLEDRPVVLTRFPDGIDGKSFFQKHAPEFSPDWIRTEAIWSEGSERNIEYFVCNDQDSLLYLANLGTIPIHVWSSRMTNLAQPDWCILDLDPKDAPFAHVVEIAREIRALCEQIELPCFVKTSGSSGLHVLLPLGTACTYEQSRTLGMLIARVVVRRRPEIATVTRNPDKREGKVYVDTVQNGHGRLLVAPLCLRPLRGAPVSTPLRWSEVTAKLDLNKYNLRSVPTRLRRQKKDPMIDVLSLKPDLVGALARLSEL